MHATGIRLDDWVIGRCDISGICLGAPVASHWFGARCALSAFIIYSPPTYTPSLAHGNNTRWRGDQRTIGSLATKDNLDTATYRPEFCPMQPDRVWRNPTWSWTVCRVHSQHKRRLPGTLKENVNISFYLHDSRYGYGSWSSSNDLSTVPVDPLFHQLLQHPVGLHPVSVDLLGDDFRMILLVQHQVLQICCLIDHLHKQQVPFPPSWQIHLYQSHIDIFHLHIQCLLVHHQTHY